MVSVSQLTIEKIYSVCQDKAQDLLKPPASLAMLSQETPSSENSVTLESAFHVRVTLVGYIS